MEIDNWLPTGEWNGFYVEAHQPKRGWMHLYLSFENGRIKGEGTDYVGPWVVQGEYDSTSRKCRWEKKYVNKHSVAYAGQITNKGIQGQWTISHLNGPFHIWPKRLGQMNEFYLQVDLNELSPQDILELN